MEKPSQESIPQHLFYSWDLASEHPKEVEGKRKDLVHYASIGIVACYQADNMSEEETGME